MLEVVTGGAATLVMTSAAAIGSAALVAMLAWIGRGQMRRRELAPLASIDARSLAGEPSGSDSANQAPEALILADADGRIRHVNAAAALMFNAVAGRLVGMKLDQVLKFLASTAPADPGDVGSSDKADRGAAIHSLLRGRARPAPITDIVRAEIEVGGERLTALVLRRADAAAAGGTAAVPPSGAELPAIDINLAHEIRQPIGAIANYAAAARKLLAASTDPAAAAALETLDKIARQAARVGEIVTHLRDLRDRDTCAHRRELLAPLLEETLAFSESELAERRIAVRWDLQASAAAFYGDRTQIQQVAINLVRNAIEAMQGQSCRELTISSRFIAANRIEVAVADTGAGIDPAVKSRLFEPFTTTKPGGTGIGLSLSRTIVELHGGTLSAQSRPEGGAIFRFTLPRADD